MNIFKFKSISLLVIMSILIACGGTDEIAEKMDEAKEVVQEKITPEDSEVESTEKKEIPNLTGELSVEVTVEVAPLTLSILEGKAQFNMRDGQGWIDAVDAQPIEQGWGVKTLAVSTAILNFEDGSNVNIKSSTITSSTTSQPFTSVTQTLWNPGQIFPCAVTSPLSHK